jgi:hypothetical protein
MPRKVFRRTHSPQNDDEEVFRLSTSNKAFTVASHSNQFGKHSIYSLTQLTSHSTDFNYRHERQILFVGILLCQSRYLSVPVDLRVSISVSCYLKVLFRNYSNSGTCCILINKFFINQVH